MPNVINGLENILKEVRKDGYETTILKNIAKITSDLKYKKEGEIASLETKDFFIEYYTGCFSYCKVQIKDNSSQISKIEYINHKIEQVVNCLTFSESHFIPFHNLYLENNHFDIIPKRLIESVHCGTINLPSSCIESFKTLNDVPEDRKIHFYGDFKDADLEITNEKRNSVEIYLHKKGIVNILNCKSLTNDEIFLIHSLKNSGVNIKDYSISNNKPEKYELQIGNGVKISYSKNNEGEINFFDISTDTDELLDNDKINHEKVVKLKSDMPKILEAAFNNLTNIEHLAIRNNFIAEIPSSIRNLTRIKYLHITNEAGGETGSLPNEIGELANLETLYLDINLDEVPGFVRNLKNLRRFTILDFGQGVEVKNIPEWIGELENLEELGINGKYKTAPDSIRRLKHLKELNVEFDMPEWIGDLTELETLMINASTIPESISKLHKLKGDYINGVITSLPESLSAQQADLLVKMVEKIKFPAVNNYYSAPNKKLAVFYTKYSHSQYHEGLMPHAVEVDNFEVLNPIIEKGVNNGSLVYVKDWINNIFSKIKYESPEKTKEFTDKLTKTLEKAKNSGLKLKGSMNRETVDNLNSSINKYLLDSMKLDKTREQTLEDINYLSFIIRINEEGSGEFFKEYAGSLAALLKNSLILKDEDLIIRAANLVDVYLDNEKSEGIKEVKTAVNQVKDGLNELSGIYEKIEKLNTRISTIIDNKQFLLTLNEENEAWHKPKAKKN
ncbi:Leucine Rich repeats (2 copies) [Candidatus Tiddalikarchaeum anstoanum]|nr:Leucine Rich repeats (2 copies) [Candidatus Tiddalikarchaeum anstoanum]